MGKIAGIEEAIELALTTFRGQKDLDGKPAVLHSLAVGMAGKTQDEMIVGFLHDVVEDSDISFDDLAEMGFQSHIIEALRLCTRDKSVPYENYVDGIIDSGNDIAMQVKLNDLSHNLHRGAKTEKKAQEDGDTALYEKISRINRKHEKALETIQSKKK